MWHVRFSTQEGQQDVKFMKKWKAFRLQKGLEKQGIRSEIVYQQDFKRATRSGLGF